MTLRRAAFAIWNRMVHSVGELTDAPDAPESPQARAQETAPESMCANAAGDLDQAMMRRALVLAETAASKGEVPVGAVIYRGEEIIAEAFNERERACDPTAHAEMIALQRAGRALGEWRLLDCAMAVTLEPCPMCAGALVNARIRKLVYGCADPKAGACSTLYAIPSDARLNHRVEVIGGVCEQECQAILQQFFRARRRKNPEL